MDDTTDQAVLVKAAEECLAAAKNFNGGPEARMALLKQVDKLRYYSEDVEGVMSRHWDNVPDMLTNDSLTPSLISADSYKGGASTSDEVQSS